MKFILFLIFCLVTTATEFLVYVRLPKTGSKTLSRELESISAQRGFKTPNNYLNFCVSHIPNTTFSRCIKQRLHDCEKTLADNIQIVEKYFPEEKILLNNFHPTYEAVMNVLKGKNITTITMIRNPIDRVVSEYFKAVNQSCVWDYSFQGRVNVPSEENLLKFMSDPKIDIGTHNRQTKMLAGYSMLDELSDLDLLSKAMYNLHQIDYVLVSEHLSEGVNCLRNKLFGLMPTDKLTKKRCDKTDCQESRFDISQSTKDIILKANFLDYILWMEAESMFFKNCAN